ncbi:MAG: GNAT family N-acetyltransferase [Marinibacterium sp.]
MTIQGMNSADLDMVLDWAAQEGWNPGLDDAAAFLAADPGGFFLRLVDGEPAAAISVVNHGADVAFLGLYICRPEFRGRGLGLDLWTHALDHAGDRIVGLDGVPAQQGNYARSGFVATGQTVRFMGRVPPTDAAAGSADIGKIMAADETAEGYARQGFARAWFADTPTRRTVHLKGCGATPAFATFRQCREGVKIGPFHAHDLAQARDLLGLCPPEFARAPLYIDVPASGVGLVDLLTGLGFEPVFDTARMYRGGAPSPRHPRFYAGATLELG